MSKSIKGTRTEANLLAAFAGESQARNKYTYYASKAKKEGFVQIAALFEETAFRGIVFPFVLGKTGTGRKGRFRAVVISAALFGALHLVNIIGNWGAAGAVLLQVGYSFLIGCMLAVVYLHTGSLAGCILLHAVYNFGGMLVPTLGQGAFADIWNLPTVLITAVLAVFAIVFYLRLLLREDALRAGSLCRLTAEQRFALRRIHV